MRCHIHRNLNRTSILLVAAAAAVIPLMPTTTVGAVWTGANITTSNTSTDTDLPANWDTGAVPGATEPAIFNWATASTISANTNAIVVGPSALFAPASIELNAGLGSGYLEINKDLTLSSLSLTAGGTTGSYYQNRFRTGVTGPVTLTLTGASPLYAETWALWQMNTANKTTVSLTNGTVNFAAMPSGDARANMNNIPFGGGGLGVQTADQQALNSELNFDAVGGTVNIAAAGVRGDGNLNLGFVSLGVRSDQTWNADPASFIRVNYRIGATGVVGPQAIRRLDAGGTRLDNLDTLNLVVVGGTTGSTGSTVATGMHLPGGEYSSLRFAFGSTTYRDNHLLLDGDVVLKGNIVTTGSNTAGGTEAAIDSAYGLALQTGSLGTGNRSHKYIVLGGHNLTINSGLLIDDNGSNTTGSTSYVATLAAADSTLSVGGDIVIRSYNANPTARAVNAAYYIARGVGITGNASTTINVAGDYSTNVASTTGGNLASSRVNFVGGTSEFKTFEVADLSTRVTHVTTNGTFNIGTFSVGTASTPGKVQLVNEFLNDNPIALSEDPNLAKVGEKLITKSLIIAADSTLDVNGQLVLIGSGSLDIAATGTLDLNTGLSLVEGGTIGSFLGIGSQSTTWNLYASRVVDSSNPTMAFSAIESDGFTMWQATAIPEPAAIALLGFAGLGLIRRRRPA